MKILGLGDNVIDYYTNLNVMYPGGNAVNVAAHGALLGQQASYLGNLGEDSFSDCIRTSLHKVGVDISRCITIPGGTTKCCYYEVVEGERSFVRLDLGNKWSGPLTIGTKELEFMEQFDVIHSSCNAKMEDEIYKLSELSALVTFDFSMKEKYRTPDYLYKVGPYLDLALFSCDYDTEEEAYRFAKKIMEYGPKNVLITQGSKGQYFYNGSELIEGTMKYREPVDTMGAGDSFVAALVVELFNQGWRKGKKAERTAIQAALSKAAEYSADNCMVAGGFPVE